MRKYIFTIILTILGAVNAFSQTTFPKTKGTDQFPAVATITLDLGGATNCAVLLTGPCSISRVAVTNTGSAYVIATAIASLDLTGTDPVLGTVHLRAGTNFLAQASTGQISSTTNIFLNNKGDLYPADSYFDVFAQIQVGGSNWVNQTAVRINTQILAIPPLGLTYTNLNQVDLVDATTSNTVGQLVQIWLEPGVAGKEARLGFSADVTGTNTFLGPYVSTNSIGAISAGICDDPHEASATIRIRRNSFSGTLTPNTGCDEITGTNLLFAAILDTNVRAPDWRGSHTGNFIIYRLDSGGRTNVVAFGQMRGTNGVGTHRAPLSTDSESCDSCSHFEGDLLGKIVDKSAFNGASLEATYAGEYVDGSGNPLPCCPPQPTPPHGAFRLAIDGVAVVPHCLTP